ncbi:multidrug efflux RND transporter permease subunit [Planctomicrobium piriforme]|uniref:Multidrug efflux pump n=1 Tax=Planctomicrobium piriforme TaxID=1576369 RepID=A0A1I3J674_9PLAN|nr:multidrug efflux RND transporter permease subunit [Planctomicrobium piriforme]SFI55737.1 multidrug efflux pump [Planctomicrobium piriforme]
MNLSEPFIRRPVATTLLTIAVTLAGALSYGLLPVSPLPQVDFPTIQVSANLPGASPETMASAVATPLERQFARIAGVSEMSSSSTLSSTSITLQFDLNRDVNAAARDVQAAINAARSQLPANLPNNPSYRKVNPADAPIMMLALTSEIYPKQKMYDVASTLLQQKIAQVPGVGQVMIGGGSLPAVRVDINPTVLNHLGISLEDVRTVLGEANANRPKGQIDSEDRSWSLSTTDQLFTADQYAPLLLAYRNGAAIRLKDVAEVTDSVEDIRAFGIFNGHPSITILIFRQPGANIIETVDRIRAIMPQLTAQIPAAMSLDVAMDRTATIRASLHDVQFTMGISVLLVILVVFLFLRDARTTFIPSVAVPISLISTFGVMYLLGYSIDNLSLMALTIATGFVVDDAIVVVENISRHLENGMRPLKAALLGASEIGFTVLSISVSLVAVFIPILLMGGVVGRLFREFAITLSVAIGISLVISLTTTPMLCAVLLKPKSEERHGRLYNASEWFFDWILSWYEWSLSLVLRHQRITMAVTLSTIAFTVYLYIIIPKGFFPQQDTGRLTGNIVADQDISFQAMSGLLRQFAAKVSEDPAVSSVVAFAGGGGGGGGSASNSARMFIGLKPRSERKETADQIVARIRKSVSSIAGANLFMQAIQDLRIGGRASSSQYQYTLQGASLSELNEWGPKLVKEFRSIPGMVDVNTDQQNKGLQTRLEVNRLTAARLGLTFQEIDNTLYDAFGQRQVSTMYRPYNQYHVVMGLEPEYWQNPDSLKHIYVRTTGNTQTPLSDLYKRELRTTSLAVPHSGQFPSATISFNLIPGTSLSEIVPRVENAVRLMGLPASIQGRFQGTAQAFQSSTSSQPVLILAALIAVYIVLGMLYESYLHPITILSTIPSAGVGALLALMWCQTELSMMALIGILLLIGIVKKNAIMMIDFAIDAERTHELDPRTAIYQACILRFRPITMTTLAALLGGLPLALGTGDGSELRRPLGIAIVGGLIFSQMLTLYTTPVVYLYIDWLRLRLAKWRGKTSNPFEADARFLEREQLLAGRH